MRMNKMSDYYMRFIPEDIFYTLDCDSINKVKNLEWSGNTPYFIFHERIHFADAGQNFESAKCPLCRADLMEWWGNIMSSAYSDEHGFVNIEATSPCCITKISLHDLDYNFPQGFYKTMIEVVPQASDKPMLETIAASLFDITGMKWRAIFAHY